MALLRAFFCLGLVAAGWQLLAPLCPRSWR